MSWVVVTQDSFAAWVTDSDPDPDERIAVVSWLLGLADGPSPMGILDPFAGSWFAEVGDTAVWIEYLVLPDLRPPAIVIRRYF